MKQLLSQHIVTKSGLEHVSELKASHSYDEIEEALMETEDGMTVLRLRGGIPMPILENIKPHMKRIEIGAMLNGVELAQVGRVLRTVLEIQSFLMI